MMRFFQRLGKSLMLPVACLPIGGLLMGIGYWIDLRRDRRKFCVNDGI